MNYRELIVNNHQLMSYSKIFANIQPGRDIFWPGCAVLSLGKEITEKSYSLLKKKVPGLVTAHIAAVSRQSIYIMARAIKK